MTICRWAGTLDLFFTFTSNPKWIEIQQFLHLKGLKVEGWLDIVSRVFKIKLNQLLKDLLHQMHFGKVLAGMLACIYFM